MSLVDTKKLLIPGIILLVVIAALTYFSSTSPDTKVSEVQKLPSKAVIEATESKKSSTPKTDIQLKPTPQKISIVEEVPPALPVITFVEGTDYITKFPNEQSKNPVVMEFFSFMCPHCFNFEPTMERWIKQKPASVELLKIPVSFGRSGPWGLAARAYYIAKELNIEQSFSKAIFRTIHIEKNPPINDADIGKVFASLGIDNRAYKKAASSFNVDANLRKAEFLIKKYQVSGVPYFLINNKYETGKASYESEQTLFRLWNHLPRKDF